MAKKIMLQITKTITKSLFKRPATLMYPKVQRTFADSYRGKIENRIGDCIFCGLCSRKCLTGALHVSKETRDWHIDFLKCIICGYCVEVCPKKCLHMLNVYSPSLSDKNMSIIRMKGEKIEKPEKTG